MGSALLGEYIHGRDCIDSAPPPQTPLPVHLPRLTPTAPVKGSRGSLIGVNKSLARSNFHPPSLTPSSLTLQFDSQQDSTQDALYRGASLILPWRFKTCLRHALG